MNPFHIHCNVANTYLYSYMLKLNWNLLTVKWNKMLVLQQRYYDLPLVYPRQILRYLKKYHSYWQIFVDSLLTVATYRKYRTIPDFLIAWLIISVGVIIRYHSIKFHYVMATSKLDFNSFFWIFSTTNHSHYYTA